MKYILFSIGMLCAYPSLHADHHTAIQELSNQIVYTHRILKNVTAIGFEVATDFHQKDIETSTAAFEASLKKLDQLELDEDLKAKTLETKMLWKLFLKQLKEDNTTHANAKALYLAGMELTNQLDRSLSDLVGSQEISDAKVRVAYTLAESRAAAYAAASLYIALLWELELDSDLIGNLEDRINQCDAQLKKAVALIAEDTDLSSNMVRLVDEWVMIKQECLQLLHDENHVVKGGALNRVLGLSARFDRNANILIGLISKDLVVTKD